MAEQEFGPIWQLEQNASHKRKCASSARNEAERKLKEAAKLDKEADEYEAAIEKLKRA